MKKSNLWSNNESWEALLKSLLVLVLGVLGEGWGAGGLQEGGLADLALDIHGLDVLLMLSVTVREEQCLSTRGSVPVLVSSQVLSASSCLSGNRRGVARYNRQERVYFVEERSYRMQKRWYIQP